MAYFSDLALAVQNDNLIHKWTSFENVFCTVWQYKNSDFAVGNTGFECSDHGCKHDQITDSRSSEYADPLYASGVKWIPVFGDNLYAETKV